MIQKRKREEIEKDVLKGGVKSIPEYTLIKLGSILEVLLDIRDSLTEEKEEYCRYCHTRPCEEEKKTCYYKCEIGNCKSPHCGKLCSCKSIKPQEEKGEAWEGKIKEQIYRNMDGFLVEAGERSIEQLNTDRHLFVKNVMEVVSSLITEETEKARQEERDRILEIMYKMEFSSVSDYYRVKSAITKN